MAKRAIRQHILARRRELSHEEWLESSHQAQQRLIDLPEFRQATCIALYAPTRNEVDTCAIMTSALATGKRVLYPAVCGDRMVFRQVKGVNCLTEGCFGILEPCSTGNDHQADEADLIVVPGVAFDRSGHRIGYGKGFYDRFLHHPDRTAHLVGLCHDFQLVENDIPAEEHDIRMEIVVTDQRVVRIGSQR